jgi:ABC-type antimicrobial peptide transport system permease subunit
MIKNYLKTAWRNLLKNKAHSLINISGLALGMSVGLLIGLWIYDEISFNKNFKNYDRIAQVIQNVTNNGEVQTWFNVPYPLAEEIRKNYGNDFQQVVMSSNMGDHIISLHEKKFKQSGGYFEHGAPELLSLKMIRGSWNSLDDPATVILSADAARSLFGDEDPINKILSVDDLPPVKVSGIYEDFPFNSTFTGLHFISTWDHLYSNSEGLRTMEDPWRPNSFSLYVRLKDNVDFDHASARIKDAKLKRVNPQLAKKKPALFLHPMTNWHLYSEFKNGLNTGGAIQYVKLFAIIGIFVLLLACINFMNLSTARSEQRAKEVGIRKTVGSLRRQLIVQFFAESVILSLAAFALSLLMVQLSLPFFNLVSNKQMTIPWNRLPFWIASLIFILLTGLVAGSYPAFYLSSFRPVKVLKGTFKAGKYAALPRKALVVLQFAVSVTFIIGTIVVYQQIQFAKNRPVGYNREGLITIPLMNSSITRHYSAVREELEKKSAIASMAESVSPTTAIWNSTSGIAWQGKDPNLSVDFGVVTVTEDYGKTVGWEIAAGRNFSRDYPSDSSAMILNETAVHFMGMKNPVGETMTWWGKPYSVIGVINDMVIESPYSLSRPVVYCLLRDDANVAILRLNPNKDAKQSLDKIRKVFSAFNPDQPFEFSFTDEDYARKFFNEERVGKLASVFAFLAIAISCLGLFGLTSFVSEQRKKEIGIRKVLGANLFNLWGLLSKDFIVLVLLSFFVAMPLSFYVMSNWLQNYIYRTSLQWWTFAATGLAALIITIIVISMQTLRAGLLNPVKSLRSE